METLKINSAIGRLNSTAIPGDERSQLVHKCSLLTLEAVGRAKNKALAAAGKPVMDYGTAFKSSAEYASAVQKCSDDALYYCAKVASKYEDKGDCVKRNERNTFTGSSLLTNPMYLRILSTFINDVQYTIAPYLTSEIVGEMVSNVVVPKGKTYSVEVTSNAVFQWYDSSWTSLRSVAQDQLYNRTITINPKPIATRGVVNFYQMVGNGGNLIDTIAAIVGGYAAKVMDKFTTAFTAAANDTRFVPSAMTATGYTDLNWATITQNVAKANRVRRDQLIGYGDFLALRKVLPDNASLASAIMMQLGNEYFKNGYIASHDNVPLYEITPAVKPATINTTMESIFPDDMIVVAARANERYAPMIMGWEEGGDMMLNLTAGDDVMATGRIEVLATASFDIAPAFASRVGLITDIQ